MKPIPKLLVAGAALAVPLVAMALASSKGGPTYVVITMTSDGGEGKYAFAQEKAPRDGYLYFGVPRSLANYVPLQKTAEKKGGDDKSDGGPPPTPKRPELYIVCVPASCNPPVPHAKDALVYDPAKSPPDDAHFFQLNIGMDSKHLLGELKGIR